jgi:transposase
MSNTAGELFADLPIPERPTEVAAARVARVLMPNRAQVQLRPSDLESLLADDHTARLVWDFVTRQDLSRLYAQIKAVEGGPGRDAIAPEILLSLWLYATLEGVGSARALSRLCEAHDAYRWLCGGVRVNHHTLSDFRVGQGAFLDDLLTVSVASLMSTGAVNLKRVAQDGMRVRASAGAASFRRKERLQALKAQAREQVERLKREVEDDPAATERRAAAARERAVREREERLAQALERMPAMEAIKRANGKPVESARVSTTDPQATVMKMADGGFRPAFNVQFATDTASQVVVGVAVTDRGSDYGEMPVMLEQLAQRYDAAPEEMLVDGGFTKLEDVEHAAAKSVAVYGPVPQPKDADRDRHVPRPNDSEAVAAWRTRMGTDEAKTIYKERAATAECVNAAARNRGLQRFQVRGLAKVTAVALLFALAHNLSRMFAFATAAMA